MKIGDWVKERGTPREGVVINANEDTVTVRFADPTWPFPVISHMCAAQVIVLKRPPPRVPADIPEALF